MFQHQAMLANIISGLPVIVDGKNIICLTRRANPLGVYATGGYAV